MPSDDDFAALAINPASVRADGIYTIPRTYGVYEVAGTPASGQRFRFGNHPVRQTELIRAYGDARLVSLYTQREIARQHARLLNELG